MTVEPRTASKVGATLLGLTLLSPASLACGCSGDRGASPLRVEAQAKEAPSSPSPSPRPLDYVVRTTPFDGAADPSARLPLVVALHGRGSTPERFASTFDGFDTPARILLVEAPIDEGNGLAWWQFRNKSAAAIDAEVRGLAVRILKTIDVAEARYPTRGRPAIMGFSQGAMLVYLLALDHPDRFSVAVPVSGALFDSFIPADGSLASAPPFVVLHGEDDPIIPASSGLRRLERLRARGATVEVRTFPDVPHWIMRGMKTALYDVLRDAINQQPA